LRANVEKMTIGAIMKADEIQQVFLNIAGTISWAYLFDRGRFFIVIAHHRNL